MSDNEALVPAADQVVAVSGIGPTSSFGAEGIVTLVEETARITKRVVATERVRVRTVTDTTEKLLRESLRTEAVAVVRVPVGRTLGQGEIPPQVRTEDGVTIIPVLEEVLVVEKRLVLVEEVHLRRTMSHEEVEVPVSVRKQRAVTERVSADDRTVEASSTQESPPS